MRWVDIEIITMFGTIFHFYLQPRYIMVCSSILTQPRPATRPPASFPQLTYAYIMYQVKAAERPTKTCCSFLNMYNCLRNKRAFFSHMILLYIREITMI